MKRHKVLTDEAALFYVYSGKFVNTFPFSNIACARGKVNCLQISPFYGYITTAIRDEYSARRVTKD